MEMTGEGGGEAMVDCIHEVGALEVLVRVSLTWGSAGSQKRAVAARRRQRGCGRDKKRGKTEDWTN